MPPAIRVDHLTKYYSIDALIKHRDSEEAPGTLSRKRIHADRGFAALDDVSFAIERGQAVGLIGSNGAGKSTLLRILAGITTASSGTLTVDGRISALLTLLGGMDPRLSGKKNIDLHGALLGLSQSDIHAHIDEIIEFSGLGDFIHAPMASYSTGMRARLAFAASMYLQSEILLVDEVLAVGDQAFQEKALQAMRGYFERGNTVIIASHNVNILRGLCNQLLWIEEGKLHRFGDTEEVLPAFLTFMNSADPVPRTKMQNIIEEVTSFNALGVERRHFPLGESIQLQIRFAGMSKLTTPLLVVTLIDFVNNQTLYTATSDQYVDVAAWHDAAIAMLLFQGLSLPPRQYRFDIALYDVLGDGERIKVDEQLFSVIYYDPEESLTPLTETNCKMIVT